MNKKILLLFFFTILSCSSKPETTAAKYQFAGWAGNPDNPNVKPHDFFYMTSLARASQNSIDKKNIRMMQNSCIEANTSQAKSKLLPKLIGESLMGRESPADGYGNYDTNTSLIKEYNDKNNEIKVKSCYPIAKPSREEPDSEWKECECVFYLYIKGGKDSIIVRAKEIESR